MGNANFGLFWPFLAIFSQIYALFVQKKRVNKNFQSIQFKICNTWPGLWKGIGSPFCNGTEPFPPSPIPPLDTWQGNELMWSRWLHHYLIIIVHITILLLILIITIVVSTMYDTWLGNELMWSRRLRHYLRSHQAHHHCRKNHWRQMRSQCQIYHISILDSLKNQLHHISILESLKSQIYPISILGSLKSQIYHFYNWIS